MKKSLFGIVSLYLASSLVLPDTLPVLAQINYTVPREARRETQRTTSSASRGCPVPLPTLQILAPKDRIASTAEVSPTFLVHVSGKSPHPLKVSVTAPSRTEPLWSSEVGIQGEGIEVIKTSPKLEAGKIYVFTVVIPCNPARPGSGAFARVVFERVGGEGEPVGSRFSLGSSVSDRPGERGENWYDAIVRAYYSSRDGFRALLKREKIELDVKASATDSE